MDTVTRRLKAVTHEFPSSFLFHSKEKKLKKKKKKESKDSRVIQSDSQILRYWFV